MFVLAIGALVWTAAVQRRRTGGVSALDNVRANRAGWLGVAVLWIALDWPLGPLAAGYLLSVHALQFLLIAFVAAPLLVLGVSRAAPAISHVRGAWPFLARATRAPIVAAIVFNIVVVATHAPSVVDSWMRSATGAFVIDAAWLAAGVLFWRPIIATSSGIRLLNTPLTMLYLILGTLFHTVIAMIMLVREFPMYAVFELAPPSFGISVMSDQQLAGGIMELGGAAIIVGYLTVLFFRWAARDGL